PGREPAFAQLLTHLRRCVHQRDSGWLLSAHSATPTSKGAPSILPSFTSTYWSAIASTARAPYTLAITSATCMPATILSGVIQDINRTCTGIITRRKNHGKNAHPNGAWYHAMTSTRTVLLFSSQLFITEPSAAQSRRCW